MCNGSSEPKAHAFLRQKSQILRQDSNTSVSAVDTDAGRTRSESKCTGSAVKVERASVDMAGRPWSAFQKGTRPLSAQKSVRRPVSAPRLLNGDAEYDQKLSRFQDAWVARRGLSAPKRKKPRDPFKDFLSDDPRMAQVMVERTMEDAHVRSCKSDLHHKAVLGKLDRHAEMELSSNFPHLSHSSKSERALPPVQGLHQLQQDMMQSHKNLCESNPEAISSFIAKVKEQKRQKRKENQENKRQENFQKSKTKSSGSLSELKTMLKAVQNPKQKTLELWNTDGAVGFRNRYRKHHDQCMLEKLDIAQAVQMYKDRQSVILDF